MVSLPGVRMNPLAYECYLQLNWGVHKRCRLLGQCDQQARGVYKAPSTRSHQTCAGIELWIYNLVPIGSSVRQPLQIAWVIDRLLGGGRWRVHIKVLYITYIAFERSHCHQSSAPTTRNIPEVSSSTQRHSFIISTTQL